MVDWISIVLIIVGVIMAMFLTAVIIGILLVKKKGFKEFTHKIMRPDVLNIHIWNDVPYDYHVTMKKEYDAKEKEDYSSKRPLD